MSLGGRIEALTATTPETPASEWFDSWARIRNLTKSARVNGWTEGWTRQLANHPTPQRLTSRRGRRG